MLLRIRSRWLACLSILAVVAMVGLGLSGCANMWSALPTESQLSAAGAIPAGTPCDSLRRGRALATTQCATCHRFFYPHEYPSNIWPAIVSNMGGAALMTEEQIDDVSRYMVAAARATRCESEPVAPAPVMSADDMTILERGRMLTQAKCVECHRLYEPHEFAPSAWPDIVREKQPLAKLTEAEVRDITWYHVEAARQGR